MLSEEEGHLFTKEHSLPKCNPISHQKHSKRMSNRTEKKNPQPLPETTKVIKFLKENVSLFTKKGSPSIISHIETY